MAEKQTKFIFVTGGVVSGLGKGITAASLGRLLKARGYHVYIISNYAENMYNQTKDKLAFLPLMDDVVMSYTIKKMKPDPAIYNYLCDENWLEPEESVFIDDRQENVNGAEVVGIHGILFKDYETAKQELNKFLRDSNILCKNFPNEG